MGIAVGQMAPDFTLQNQDKQDVKLSDFAGKKNVVIVFYPLDWSPVCTNEHACFVNDMKSFATLDAEVLGVSVDSVWSHKAYAEKMGIKYSLLADFQPRGAMAEKYDVFLADKGITGRAIVIVNKDGKIAWIKNYDIPVVPDLKEVAAALQQVKQQGLRHKIETRKWKAEARRIPGLLFCCATQPVPSGRVAPFSRLRGFRVKESRGESAREARGRGRGCHPR
jgi:peroxiredoxin